jgi:hypothetical protein
MHWGVHHTCLAHSPERHTSSKRSVSNLSWSMAKHLKPHKLIHTGQVLNMPMLVMTMLLIMPLLVITMLLNKF